MSEVLKYFRENRIAEEIERLSFEGFSGIVLPFNTHDCCRKTREVSAKTKFASFARHCYEVHRLPRIMLAIRHRRKGERYTFSRLFYELKRVFANLR